MGRGGIGDFAKDSLLEEILSGATLPKSAAKIGIDPVTAHKYYRLWLEAGQIPPEHKCKCGKDYSHRAACPKPKLTLDGAPAEQHSEIEWGQMLVDIREELLHYSIKKTRDHTQAEELVSITIEKCWRSRDRFVKGTNFRAWMYTCLNNHWMSYFRRKRRSSEETIEDLEQTHPIIVSIPESTSDLVLANEIIVKIAREIECRETCFLCWLDGRTYEEIAAIQQITVGTVKSRLWRAKEKLRGILGEGGINSEEGRENDQIG